MIPGRHPAPFEPHFSEGWRTRFEGDRDTGSWKHLHRMKQTDADLAAQISVAAARGICLAGKSWAGLSASILANLRWPERRLAGNPAHAVLHA
jgi:hypothetical protein